LIRAIVVACALFAGANAAAQNVAPRDLPIGQTNAPRPTTAAAVTPDLVATTDTARLAAALRVAGFAAEVSRQGDGAVVLAGANGAKFQATASNCLAAGAACTDIELYARFPDRPRPRLEVLNGWNNRTRYARAFLDPDGVAALQFDVGLSGGISQDNLAFQFELWAGAMETYSRFLAATATPRQAEPRASAPTPPRK
jgi:hypothetical protein